MQTTSDNPAKRNWNPYLLGAALSYVFCVVVFGRKFVAGASWDFKTAAVGAICFWPFLAAAHAGVQWPLRTVVIECWSWGKRHETPILNAPLVALMVLAGLAARGEPKAAFRRFILDPIPKEVRITQFSRWHGIGEPMSLGLVFQAQEADVVEILRAGGYALAPDATNNDGRRGGRVCRSGNLGLEFDEELHRILYVSTNDSGKRLLLRTNHSEAIFFYAKPYK